MEQWLEKRAMTKLAAGMTTDKVLQEFDQVMLGHAKEYVERLRQHWTNLSYDGPRVSKSDWDTVMAHIMEKVPEIGPLPAYAATSASRAA